MLPAGQVMDGAECGYGWPVKIGYGLITCQRFPGDPRSAADLYREALELCALADQVGLDSVWTSEHHFWDDDYMPSLLVMSAAIAARTERITIGTGILLAPLYDPLRLAEDAATVDLISGGRFILGLGIGWRAEEFDRLGIPMADVGRRMSETIKVLRLAWGPSTFTFEGKVFRYEPTNVTPKPTRQIPIWVGAFSDPALKRAGRLGDGYLGSATVLDDMSRRMEVVNTSRDKAGRSAEPFTFAVHEPVWVEQRGQGAEEVMAFVNHSRWKYEDMGPAYGRGTDGPLPEAPPLDDARRQWIVQRLISGDAKQVASKIDEFRQVVGEDLHFVARSYYPGIPFDDARRSIELLAEVKALLG